MTTLPLVTVITATYNRADFIEETIESILAQDYPNLEYIVIDDGSTDKTASVMEKYQGRLSYHSQSNRGESASVNRGLSLASGEFISVVSSDDVLLPGAISAMVAALQEKPEAVVAYTDWIGIDIEGRVGYMVRHTQQTLIEMLRWHDCPFGPGALFRRADALAVGGRDESIRFVADFDFWVRLGLRGDFVHLARFGAGFRFHPTATTYAARGLEMGREHIDFVERFFSQDLPYSLKAVRGDALSSAYFVAGCVGSKNVRDRLRMFRGMLAWSSLSFARKQARRWGSVVYLLLDRLPLVSALGQFYLKERAGTHDPWRGRHYSLVPESDSP